MVVLCYLSLVSFSHVMFVEAVELKLYWLWRPQIVKLHAKAKVIVLSCNSLTIGLVLVLCALCFMHLVSKRSFFFFLMGRVTGYPSRVGSRVNSFLLQVKKIEFGSDIFQVGLKNSDPFCHVYLFAYQNKFIQKKGEQINKTTQIILDIYIYIYIWLTLY